MLVSVYVHGMLQIDESLSTTQHNTKPQPKSNGSSKSQPRNHEY